jgi:hypothetical protein
MRTLALACVTVLAAACGTEPMGDDDGMGSGSGSGSGSGEQATFSIQSKPVMIGRGEEITYCYWFSTPNTADVVVKKWTSQMTPGSHHMIVYWGGNQPDGTLEARDSCVGGIPQWVYAAQTPEGELPMPADDGTGKPLGMNVPAGQKGVIEMHYFNSSDEPLMVSVTLNAFAHAAGTDYTPTAAYITYNNSINIPTGAQNYPVTQSCAISSSHKFWTVSTHAHKNAIKTEIKDGTEMVFQATDWEHPGARSWTMPYYQFSSGSITYTCTYNNNTGAPIVAGPSAKTNEMCMATGYIFPATAAKFCFDGFGGL